MKNKIQKTSIKIFIAAALLIHTQKINFLKNLRKYYHFTPSY